MDACLVSKSGLVPWANPTGVFNLHVPASFLDLSFGRMEVWITLVVFFGLTGLLDFSHKETSFGQFPGFTVLMEFTKVRLENKICYVILL